MFENHLINFEILNQRAHNLRWANVPDGVIPLTAADPDFPCAPEITAAIQKFIKDRYFCYAPPEGYLFFREAAAQFFYTKRNIVVNPANILPVDSAAFGIELICRSFLKPGDEAIVFDPVDFLFKYAIENQGATAVSLPIPINPVLSIDYQQLESLITTKTKLLCLCNPVNPTGKVFTKEELETIGRIAIKHQLIILADEIWSDIVFHPSAFTSIASLDSNIAKQTIVVTGFSKSYALAGLRIGLLMTLNDQYFQQIFTTSQHSSTVHGANVLGQVAATSALTDCDYWLQSFLQHLEKIRDIGYQSINNIENISCFSPQGCYLFWCDIRNTGYSSSELTALLLNKAKVYVVPGLPKWFGKEAEGFIRICFSTSETVFKEAMERIKNTLTN